MFNVKADVGFFKAKQIKPKISVSEDFVTPNRKNQFTHTHTHTTSLGTCPYITCLGLHLHNVFSPPLPIFFVPGTVMCNQTEMMHLRDVRSTLNLSEHALVPFLHNLQTNPIGFGSLFT